MNRVSRLLMVGAAIAVDWSRLGSTAGALAIADQPTFVQAATTASAANRAKQPAQLAEAPLRPPATRRSRPDSRSSDSDFNGNSNDRLPLPRSASPSSVPSTAAFQYRLIVQGNSNSLLQQVRRVVPDAFRAVVDGRQVIQAGLFADREAAEVVQQQLRQLSLASSLIDFEPSPSTSSRLATLSTTPILRSPSSSSPPRASTSSSSNQQYSYRLVVQGSSDSLLQQVRRVIPDAFRNTIAGRSVIQAGLYVDRAAAETVQRQLAFVNAETNILDVSYGLAQSVAPTARSFVRKARVVVAVDPGHGGNDPGAVGIGNIHEADIVLDVAQQVADLLEQSGVQAVLTRSDDREIDLAPRVNLAESINADLFVSIHANSIDMSRPDVNGIETYYYDNGSALAASIHNSLVAATGMNDRGIRQARFYVLTRTSMPAVLVEIGFVTGQEDAARLNRASARSQIATGIAEGILRFIQ